MYYTYENGRLVSKADEYENPSSYLQYGTNETGRNRGKANGWEQGVSDGISGVADGMGFGAIAGVGKAAYSGLKSTNSAAGDATAHFFGPHHTTFGIFDDTLAWQKDPNRTQAKGASIAKNGILNMFGLGFVADIFRGQEKRKEEAYAKYVNSVDQPFLFAIDENGMQFSKAKAAPPEPIQDKTGWIRNLGAVAGAGLKAGMGAKKAKKNEVAPNTEIQLNKDQPKNLAFMENPLCENFGGDQSYKNADTRFDINRGDNGRDFMYNNREGAPWNTTFGFKKGGSVKVEGGQGGDDIALVDTNTGKDTGVRVEKDEMIVFSKKNVEALEQAIKSGKKNDVFAIVKDQLKQVPEEKEETVGFSGGGKYDDFSEDELKAAYKAESDKKVGKISLDELWLLEKTMKDKGIKFEEQHILPEAVRKGVGDFINTTAATAKGLLWDAPMALSEKAKDFGDPIKDPKGYAKILQTKSEQMYIKRHGEPKVNLGSLQMNFDRKKLKAIEDELRARDMENIRKGKAEEVGKIMPSDNETKGDRGVDETLKLLHPDYKNVKKPKIGNYDKIENGVETWSTNVSRRDYATDGAIPTTTKSSTTTKGSTTSSNNTTPTTTTTPTTFTPYSMTPNGDAVTDKTMLDVPKVASGLNTPKADVVNTDPDKQRSDFAGNFLGYSGDAIKLGLGMSAASKSLPQWTVSDNWNEYMGKMKFMSNMGLTPEQKATYQDTADSTYRYDVDNIYNLSNGNAGTALGNIGRANKSRYRSGVEFAMADRNAQIANNQQYGNWLAADEQYRKSIFDENRNQLAMTKKAGMQLASDALANMDNRADYNKFYGKGSHVQKLQDMQLEEQQFNNDILKAKSKNYADPKFWENYIAGKKDGTKSEKLDLFSALKDATPEEIEAIKKLWK